MHIVFLTLEEFIKNLMLLFESIWNRQRLIDVQLIFNIPRDVK